jgi:Cloacin immunity protein
MSKHQHEIELERTLRWFDKTTEELSGEELLNRIDLATLQRIFGVPDDEPMIDVFPVLSADADRLQAHIDHHFDHARFDYFVYAHLAE